MPDNLLPALLLQILVVGCAPGPANIYALTSAIRHGRVKSLPMWCGLFTGAVIAVGIMAVLTHFIGEALGSYVVWLKYLGAAYLLWLAYRIWQTDTGAAGGKRECTFLSGMVMQLTNAKILLLELSVFSSFVLPYSSEFKDLIPVAALLLLAGPGANLLWLLAGGFLSHFLKRHSKAVSAVSAVALALCAIYIAFF